MFLPTLIVLSLVSMALIVVIDGRHPPNHLQWSHGDAGTFESCPDRSGYPDSDFAEWRRDRAAIAAAESIKHSHRLNDAGGCQLCQGGAAHGSGNSDGQPEPVNHPPSRPVTFDIRLNWDYRDKWWQSPLICVSWQCDCKVHLCTALSAEDLRTWQTNPAAARTCQCLNPECALEYQGGVFLAASMTFDRWRNDEQLSALAN